MGNKSGLARRRGTAFLCGEIYSYHALRERVGREAHMAAGLETGATSAYLPESRVSMAFW
jgi:hypothetical protein